MKNPFFIIITALLFFSSCKSKIETISDASCESCEDAIIRFYGEPASDGCGWVLEASETIYMPKNLLSEFYTDNLKVRIKYKVLERVNCGILKDAYPSIFIEDIFKQ
jgi:hypothetical protein